MCLMLFDSEVSSTRIFVAPNYNGTRQLTVYSNEAKTYH